jgi:formylglycine-generating enzyme required for sulfatase activity
VAVPPVSAPGQSKNKMIGWGLAILAAVVISVFLAWRSGPHAISVPAPANSTSAGSVVTHPKTVEQPSLDMSTKVRKLSLGGGVDLELLPCPAGTFTMGSPAGEADRSADETQHQVTLTKPFWLGKTEVTQAQWQAVMGANPSQFKGNDLPVEHVSWDDAASFCKKLTERAQAAGTLPAGYEYRMPTDAEWEYACRAGSTGPYAGARLDDLGWYYGNSGRTTHAVGTKQANAWGLVDMHGNVCEWCQGWYGDYPAGVAPDPTGLATGTSRVSRGGSWSSLASSCRAAYRCGFVPSFRNDFLGFRIALAPAVR